MKEITIPKNIDLVKFVQDVYDLSLPQGMGLLHYEPGDLTEDEAKQLIKQWDGDAFSVVGLDYVKGRACKMHIYKEVGVNGKWYIPAKWYDHSDADLKELLKRHNIKLLT